MELDTALVARVAGWSAGAAIVTLLLSGLTIALFFGGAGSFWGPVNDVFAALTLALLAAPVVAVYALADDLVGPWLGVVTLLGLAGIAIAVVGQLLLVARAISLRTSFVTGGLGVVLLGLWAVGSAVVAFQTDALSAAIGWLVLLVLGLSAATAVAAFTVKRFAVVALSVALLAALAAWLGALAAELLSWA